MKNRISSTKRKGLRKLMNSRNGNGNKMNIIELKDIVKSFPVGDDEVKVLHGISLNIEQGEFVSIVGPSGNGKST
ncbi:MAG: ATP-binding cassette domain-containing protein, partial [Candidatus Promineifilaceae bacterium]